MTRDEIIKLVEQRQQIEPPPMLEQLQQGDIHWILGSRDVLWIVEQAVEAERKARLADIATVCAAINRLPYWHALSSHDVLDALEEITRARSKP
jgi:hypothetical protein